MMGLVLLFVVGLIVSTGLGVLVPPQLLEGDAGVRWLLAMQGASQLLMFFVPVLLYAALMRGGVGEELRLDFGGRKWLLGLVAVVVSLLLMPFNDWLTAWNDGWHLGPLEEPMRQLTALSEAAAERMLSLTGMGDLLLQLVVVALIPAVCEELFFRGGVQQILQRWTGNAHVGVVLCALIFAVAHGDVYGLVPRLVMGLLLGYLFYLSGSMVVNVCAHFFNNGSIVVMYWLYHSGATVPDPMEPLGFPWVVIVPCLLGGALLFWQYFARRPQG